MPLSQVLYGDFLGGIFPNMTHVITNQLKTMFFKSVSHPLTLSAFTTLTLLSISSQSAIAITLGFENNFNDWEISGTTSIETNAIGSNPTEGTSQALLSTGGTPTQVFVPPPLVSTLGEGLEAGGFLFPNTEITDFGNNLSPSVSYTQGSAIKIQTNISANAGDVLKFDYNFLTNEDSSQTIWGDDLAFVSLNNQLFEIAIFSDVESSLLNSATPFTRETSYQEYSLTIPSDGNFLLGFGVVDGDDTAGDSALLLDNVRVESSSVAPVPESNFFWGLLTVGGILGISYLKKY
jgi:hypothetical protein